MSELDEPNVYHMLGHRLKVSSLMLDFERWTRSWSRFLGSQPADDSHKHGGRVPLVSTRSADIDQSCTILSESGLWLY